MAGTRRGVGPFDTTRAIAVPVSAVLGVPSARLRDPFPASQPVVPAYEKSLGRYTSLGDSLSYVGNR